MDLIDSVLDVDPQHPQAKDPHLLVTNLRNAQKKDQLPTSQYSVHDLHWMGFGGSCDAPVDKDVCLNIFFTANPWVK